MKKNKKPMMINKNWQLKLVLRKQTKMRINTLITYNIHRMKVDHQSRNYLQIQLKTFLCLSKYLL